jgi:hypothetical protein
MVEDLNVEDTAKLEHWPVEGVDHVITKSVRIWYTYEVPAYTDADGKPHPARTVGSWLLVGYVGNGHE